MTHNFHSVVYVGEDTFPMEFYVMSVKSSQGIVLGYEFLATQGAVIDFGSKQVTLKGKQVSCMKKQVEGPKEVDQVHKVHAIETLYL